MLSKDERPYGDLRRGANEHDHGTEGNVRTAVSGVALDFDAYVLETSTMYGAEYNPDMVGLEAEGLGKYLRDHFRLFFVRLTMV